MGCKAHSIRADARRSNTGSERGAGNPELHRIVGEINGIRMGRHARALRELGLDHPVVHAASPCISS